MASSFQPKGIKIVTNDSEYISANTSLHTPPIDELSPTSPDENKKRLSINKIIEKSNTRLTHEKCPSRSMTNPFNLPDLGIVTATAGGYGLFNAYDDQYDDIKYTAGASTTEAVHSPSYSAKAQPHEVEPESSENSQLTNPRINDESRTNSQINDDDNDADAEEENQNDVLDDNEDVLHHTNPQLTNNEYIAVNTLHDDEDEEEDDINADTNHQYMALNTTNIDEEGDIDDDKPDTNEMKRTTKPPRKNTQERLMIEIKLATDDHIRVHSNYELSDDESKCFHVLHWFGFLHFVHIIYRNIYYQDISLRHAHIDTLLKGIAFKDFVLFESLRYYINFYCTSDYHVVETILEEIEAFHGESYDDQQKKKTLRKYWNDIVHIECTKNVYLIPLMLGWIQTFCILYIEWILIVIIFTQLDGEEIQNDERLYVLSLLVIVSTALQIIGILSQYTICNRAFFVGILRESKAMFMDENVSDLNERYIGVQKWMNTLIVTAHPHFKRCFAQYVIRKYAFLLVLSVALFTVIVKSIKFNYLDVECVYILFELGLLPLWMIFNVVGLKQCLRFIAWYKKYFGALCVYFVLFALQCIHYYGDHVEFIANMQFVDNYIVMVHVMVYLNIILNLILFYFALKYGYKYDSAYYFMSLLLIYLFITLKIFMDPGIFPSDSKYLTNFQYIFKIIIYVLISVSNFLYFYMIQVKYLDTNGISINKCIFRLIYSFCSLFLCNYQCVNTKYTDS